MRPSLPSLLLALILTIYWARVLRLVYKLWKSTGRSANFIPTEPLGRRLRLIWHPVITLWIMHCYLSAFLPKPPLLLHELYENVILDWGALAVAALALAGTLVCWKKMGKSWRMGINPDEKTQLVITGPYAYVRHPIYALQSVLMLASMAILPSPLMLGLGMVLVLLLQWEAHREERYLSMQHGDGYVDYCRQVGRFLPRSWRGYHP